MSVPSGSSFSLHFSFFFLVKLEEGNAQTGNNNQQQTSTSPFVYELPRQCFHYIWVCMCVFVCVRVCDFGKMYVCNGAGGGKQTNIVDEYSTSRTPEKCTCFHCKESGQDKSSFSPFTSFSPPTPSPCFLAPFLCCLAPPPYAPI